jgi:pimeloyl-ACP methyl ester carboxylesterase
VSLLGVSQAGPICIAYAAAHPARVTRLVLVDAYQTGAAVAPPELRASLVALVRASWGIGSHALASIFVPGDDAAFRKNLSTSFDGVRVLPHVTQSAWIGDDSSAAGTAADGDHVVVSRTSAGRACVRERPR